MKRLLGALSLSLVMSLAFVGHAAHASPSAPVLNKEYTVLTPPQPVSTPAGKIEVTEFFWYGCPHCYALEPLIEAWAKKKGDDVVFRRIPVAFRPEFEAHSRMYHALDALGIAEEMTPKVFNEIHVKKDYLLTPEAQATFLAANGVDRKKYLDAYNSFGVQSAVKRDATMLTDYKIDGVPTIVVQGKYVTSPAQANSLEGAITVLDWLDAQVRAKKL